MRASAVGIYIHILREASALSVLLYRVLRRPQKAERADKYGAHAFSFPNPLTANEKHPKAHKNLIVMNTNYLIHFNKSAESDEVLKEFFGNENLFIKEVLDKVRFNLERDVAPVNYMSTEFMSIHNLTIKFIEQRLNV